MISLDTNIRNALRKRQGGFLLNPYRFGGGSPPVPSDPYYSDVYLLLHGDGPDGSTAIVDSSPSIKTIVVNGNTKIVTSPNYAGLSTIALDGSGDYMTLVGDTSNGMGTGDFTIEAFVRYNASVGSTQVIVDYRPAANGAYPTLQARGGVFCYVANAAEPITGSGMTIVPEVWYHVAVCRISGVTRLFVDGVQRGSDYSDGTNYLNVGSGRPWIGVDGGFGAGQWMNGNIRDLRITKNIGRYSTTFSPPFPPFPH